MTAAPDSRKRWVGRFVRVVAGKHRGIAGLVRHVFVLDGELRLKIEAKPMPATVSAAEVRWVCFENEGLAG